MEHLGGRNLQSSGLWAVHSSDDTGELIQALPGRNTTVPCSSEFSGRVCSYLRGPNVIKLLLVETIP
jgi:hypothetical protein